MENDKDCLRSLRSPKTEGDNLLSGHEYPGGYPDTYKGTYWMDVSNCTIPNSYNHYCYCHNNSTVLSHWFYLLSEGGDGYNDFNNYYDVSGLGIDWAADIVWRTQLYKLPNCQEAQYDDVKNLTIQAAAELSNNNQTSLEVLQVKNAWYAAGVLDTPPDQMSITGNTSICPFGDTYTIDNLPTGCSVSWTSSNNINTTTTGYGEIFATPSSSGPGWIQATITSNYSSTSITLDSFYITIASSPWLYYILPEYGNYYGYEGNSYSFHVWPETYSSYNFSIYPPYAYINWIQGAVVNIYFPYPDIPFTISAYTNNGACNSNIVSMQFFVYGMDFLLSPNPASEEVTITITGDKSDNSMDLSKSDQVYDVSILDFNGNLKIKREYSGNKFSIPVYTLKDGEYLIRIDNGKSKATKQLIIKH